MKHTFTTTVKCFALIAAISTGSLIDDAYAKTTAGFATAEIREAISVVQTVAMSFGVIQNDGNSDNITLSTANTASSANGSNILPGTSTSGRFVASGTPNAAISITFTDGVLNGLGETIAINQLSHDAGESPFFDSSGLLTVNVGANLNINAAQNAGIYAGLYTISVNYP